MSQSKRPPVRSLRPSPYRPERNIIAWMRDALADHWWWIASIILLTFLALMNLRAP